MKNSILRTVVTMLLSQGAFAAAEVSDQERRLDEFKANILVVIETAKSHKDDIEAHVLAAKAELEGMAANLKEEAQDVVAGADLEGFKDSVTAEIDNAKAELDKFLPQFKKEVDAAVDRGAAAAERLADQIGIDKQTQEQVAEKVRNLFSDIKW